MSFDIKIQNICDHKILLERSALEEDLLTVRTKHYVASTTYFEVYRFGNLVNKSQYTLAEETSPEFNYLHAKKVIRFKKKEKVNTPLYEVNYITVPEDCPKCSGVRYLDDMVLDKDGDVKKVQKENLLAQLVEKYVVTEVGSNRFHRWLGTGLVNLTTMKVQDVNFIMLRIREEIIKCLDNLKDVQKQQVGSNQEVTDGERLDRVLGVDITRGDDPTIFNVSVQYRSVRGNTMDFNQQIELTQFRQLSAS